MNWALLQNSLLVALLTTAISSAIGFFSALWIAGSAPRLRTFFLAVAVLALALPPFLVTNCWLNLLGQNGIWHRWVPFNILSLGGTVWVLSQLLWPLTLLLVWGAWQKLEPSQLESDMQVAGTALIRVLLFPLARGALIQAAVLTLVLALNNFAVPAILQVKVFPAEMWVRFNTEFDTPGALRLSWPLVLPPLALMFWLSRHELPWPHMASSVSGRLFRQQLGPAWFSFSGVCALLVCFFSVAVPVFQILSAQRTWTELPGALAAGATAIWNSFWYAAVAATLILGIGLWIATRHMTRGVRQDRGDNWMHFKNAAFVLGRMVVWLAFLLPGVLLGIGLIHVFNHAWSAMFYQSAGIVILAFAIRYLVIGLEATHRVVKRADRDLMDVALLEGATRTQLLRHVIWPQAGRTVQVAWYIVFLACLWDVESMILVVPPGGETLALRIFNLLHYGHNAQVDALCLALLCVALVPLLASGLWRMRHAAYIRLMRAQPVGSELGTRVGAGIVLWGVVTIPFMLLLFTACTPSSSHGLESKLFDHVQIVGSRGVGVGQLNKPRSVAVDTQDNLYVVDMTGRVQKFSPDGVFLLSWQMPQTDLGKPKGMGRDRDGNIIVVEPHYSRVNIFSPLGKLLAQWGSHGTNTGHFTMPRGVAVDSRGEFFVSEYQGAERVQKFVFGATARDVAANRAAGWTPPDCVACFGQAGTDPGQFNRPEGLCVDTQDRLYVADSCNHRIQIFDRNGHFLRAHGKAGRGPGELSYPYDICVDAAGRQYVCEFGNSRVQVFDAQDQPIEIIGGPGAEPGRFSNPWGVALDSAGNLYVADSQNHRVQKLMRRK
jgi:ABC-type Fe3+ transport system permease subunit/DNA-binding beta-propeller fold protein YncE